jgi:dTMP kinase
MDSDTAASVERARRRNQASSGCGEVDENRFEQENRAFFERVHDKFLEIARREPERVFMVDARRPADVVFPEILAAVKDRLLR